jgi:hypothetical protein
MIQILLYCYNLSLFPRTGRDNRQKRAEDKDGLFTAMQMTEEEDLLRRLPKKRGTVGSGRPLETGTPAEGTRGGARNKPAMKGSIFL